MNEAVYFIKGESMFLSALQANPQWAKPFYIIADPEKTQTNRIPVSKELAFFLANLPECAFDLFVIQKQNPQDGRSDQTQPAIIANRVDTPLVSKSTTTKPTQDKSPPKPPFQQRPYPIESSINNVQINTQEPQSPTPIGNGIPDYVYREMGEYLLNKALKKQQTPADDEEIVDDGFVLVAHPTT